MAYWLMDAFETIRRKILYLVKNLYNENYVQTLLSPQHYKLFSGTALLCVKQHQTSANGTLM